jgi:predicted phosphodiesterase/uncharacterized protein (UPF0333 family)
MKITRRKLLTGGAIAGLASYSYIRGLRYPTLSWSPTALAATQSFKNCDINLANCIFSNYRFLDDPQDPSADDNIYVRAFDTQPEVEITPKANIPIKLFINNVTPLARLDITKPNGEQVKIHEDTQGITRVLSISGNSSQPLQLKWTLPENKQSYKVASVGDSGGNTELDWCLKRAEELGADFFVHLGDFVYNPGEYDLATKKFYNSNIPCYISIGNHDFHDDGLIYPRFRDQLGPLNHTINLLGTQLINLDTAADFFPVDSGRRGAFVSALLTDQNQYDERLIMTHRPIKDARQGHDHVVGSIGEIDWLKQLCQDLGVANYINGHVHMTAENDIEGLRQLTVGEGLSFNDLLIKKPVAQMLMINIKQGEKPELKFERMHMPDNYRCSSYQLRAMLGGTNHSDISKLQKQQLDLCKVDI